MNKKNIESINAAIVAQIKGGFVPWVKDWKTDTGAFSHVTKKCYSELNSYIVGSGEYASFEQWKKEGFFPEKESAKYIMLFKAWNPETRKIVDNSEAEADDDPKIIIEDNFHREITAVKGEKYNYHFYENGLGVVYEGK